MDPTRLGEDGSTESGLPHDAAEQVRGHALEASRNVYATWLPTRYPAARMGWLAPAVAGVVFPRRLEAVGGGALRVFLCRVLPDDWFREILTPCGVAIVNPISRSVDLRPHRTAPVELDACVERGRSLFSEKGWAAMRVIAARAALLGR
jgi:hypothetical protein